MAEAGRANEEEVRRIAEDVEAGSDQIDVPEELVEEEKDELPEERTASKALSAQIREMTVAQRMKLAFKGNKEARTLLLRDPVPMIQRFVLKNPRIAEDEILALAKDRNANKDIVRTISESRDWARSYAIRRALVENPKCPMVTAIRFLSTLRERDIRSLARSRNIPTTVAAQARRILHQREQARKS